MSRKNWFEMADEVEEEWQRPFTERLAKILVVAGGTLVCNYLIEKSWNRWVQTHPNEPDFIETDVID